MITAVPDDLTGSATPRQILSDHLREAREGIQHRVRDGRGRASAEVRDDLEHADDDSRGGIDFMLLEMRSSTAALVEQSLARMKAGAYGTCADCAGRIPQRRLDVLPFALRCRSCETSREDALERLRHSHPRRMGLLQLANGAGL
jgi:DnaK suppressor protein